MPMKTTVVSIALSLSFAFLLGALLHFVFFPPQSQQPSTKKANSIIQLNAPVAPFILQASTGKNLTERNLIGKWDLVFFGYTHCPDICPVTLQKMQQMTAQLAHDNPKLLANTQVIFISVDPKRDTPSHLRDYMNFFNADFIGASGSEETLSTVARSLFAVYETPDTTKEHYLVNHSGNIHIISPQGHLVAILKEPFDNLLARYFAVVRAHS